VDECIDVTARNTSDESTAGGLLLLFHFHSFLELSEERGKCEGTAAWTAHRTGLSHR